MPDTWLLHDALTDADYYESDDVKQGLRVLYNLTEKIESLERDVYNLTDKIEGLEEDLHSAVRVAWDHGAKDWVKVNYPKWAEEWER